MLFFLPGFPVGSGIGEGVGSGVGSSVGAAVGSGVDVGSGVGSAAERIVSCSVCAIESGAVVWDGPSEVFTAQPVNMDAVMKSVRITQMGLFMLHSFTALYTNPRFLSTTENRRIAPPVLMKFRYSIIRLSEGTHGTL